MLNWQLIYILENQYLYIRVYISDDPNDSFMINWVLKPLFLGQSLHNMGEMEAYMKTECPDIDYTSVRPPQLSNGSTSGKQLHMYMVVFHH